MSDQNLPEEPRYPEASSVGIGVVASWTLAMLFGVAFWTVVFRVAAPVIMHHV